MPMPRRSLGKQGHQVGAANELGRVAIPDCGLTWSIRYDCPTGSCSYVVIRTLHMWELVHANVIDEISRNVVGLEIVPSSAVRCESM